MCMHYEHRSISYSNVQQSMVQELHKCSETWRKQVYRIFLCGLGGTGKSHVVHLIQRDMSHFFKHTVKHDDDQPIVLITSPARSVAFQIGGSTIHSTFLLCDNFKSKPHWEKSDAIEIRAHAVNN